MNYNPISRGGRLTAAVRAVQAVQRSLQPGQGLGVGTLTTTRGYFPPVVRRKPVAPSSGGNFIATWQ